MSWPIVELGSVVSFVGGSQPPKSTFKFEPEDDYVRLLQIRDYKSDKNLTFIPESSTKKFCKKDDVMIGRYGPPVFQILRGLEGAYNVALMKAVPSEKVDKDYLYYFLKQDKLFRLIDSLSQRTAGQSGIDMDALKSYPMLLPPLEEQKRIAAILDKADAIRQKRKQAIELADEFLRSVFLDMFGDIPAGFSKYPLVGCRGSVKAASGKSSKGVISDSSTDIPIYGGNGINGYATEALYSKPVVIVGRVGQQCGITTLTDGPCWVTDNAIVLEITDLKKYDAAYLAHALKHSPLRDSVKRLDLPFVNQSMILDYKIPLPPISEQKKFGSIRKNLLKHLSLQQKGIGISEDNFQVLSQQAFSGQL
ncbi:restriction endonuclease subunit S [Photobacterium angustum]|uniref:Putative type I restriction-modification system specificity subunit n=1 Tax=Photobacterium angustum (strain S14 / CCUG 15956) TaxID=314292 RepID=Q1ZQD0_PHOAS|nr:restriction endonuclease subunit S [Photobacterium angustum]EAS64367.1 putative type I restriction-modification system specificity subunit [Photobacterium angustum S14]